ncbi:metallophosphoesterase [Bacillus thuringiensis]|uniref:metallophosphoesterase n=1 Tax=Bacillus thuringiensis TaxID=1428 RepID=UPI00299F7399|nr:metallophosphoesterase [Bacillus thuringiensis]
MWRNQKQTSNFTAPPGLIQSLVITSDPQYPWTDCTEGPPFNNCNISSVSPCFNVKNEDQSTKERRSEALIREQYNNINSYMNSLSGVNGAVLINGDVTAYGHGWQWNKMNSLMNTLNRTYYYGLGNHDIGNTGVPLDCANNGCFKNSMHNFINNHIFSASRRSTVKGVDFRTGTEWNGSIGFRDYERGSFAYVLEFGNIHSIQLQNYPTMRAEAKSFTHATYIEPNFNWLRDRLIAARNGGKTIIINVHQSGSLTTEYTNLFQQYGVRAVFSGHVHTSYGNVGTINNIPHFRSGSAMYRTYLILEQFSNRLDTYAVSCNDWRNRCLVNPIFSGQHQIVTALNNSSVLSFDGSPDGNVVLSSNNNASTQKWNFSYNSTKNGYIISSPSNTNLVLAWNAEGTSRNVFATPFVSAYDEHYWALERVNNNEYIFKNKKNPNLVLDVFNSQTSNGTNISVHERHALNTTARNQTFLIYPI